MGRHRRSSSVAYRERARSDELILAERAADAGLNTFGCVFLEVWALTEDGTKLTRPTGGHWMDPAFAQSLPNETLVETAWGVDRNAPDCPPGAGLAGIMADEGGLANSDIHWRQILTLLKDPFVQRESGRRMERLHEIGIGLVAAVPFNFQDDMGIVMFYSRSTVNVELLRSASNEHYMVGSANLIGATYAIRKAHKVRAEMRRKMFRAAVKKVRKELVQHKTSLATMVLDQDDMEKLREEREAAQSIEELTNRDNFAVKLAKGAYEFGKKSLERVKHSSRKWHGANLHGPPRQPFSDCLFVFIGCFITMLLLLKTAKSIGVDDKFNFEAGWYTSTLCILFALTPAPVGQPRQIFMAHLWNMLVGLACRQIPTGGFGDFMDWRNSSPDSTYGLPLIYVQALAVALGIAGQAFIGILHPPATGFSMTFASKPQWTGTTIVAVMLADAVVVLISMMYLNLSHKKQYPLFWLGFGWQGGGGTVGFVRRRSIRVRQTARTARSSISRSSRRSGNGGDEDEVV